MTAEALLKGLMPGTSPTASASPEGQRHQFAVPIAKYLILMGQKRFPQALRHNPSAGSETTGA